ncbi:MAG: CopG family transcriptional regulator [Richelia sp. RM2_1_2]|nr:CopG family transcriptional regulator [Richelia sp. RM2_1_2]
MNEIHVINMPRKVLNEEIKRLSVELPISEYNILEEYCLQNQETKRQIIRNFIRTLKIK